MKTKIMISVLMFLSIQNSTHATGFDCNFERLNETEKAICNTPYLNGIDNVTNKLFIIALNNTISKEVVQSGQIEWLKERNSCRDNVLCIKESYLQRNAELSSIQAFQPISDVFPDTLIDASFDNEIKMALLFGIILGW
ncbi:lysozyme inhibitor LprI family protein [Serratia sp. NPDC078593]|uniref:lysozyme inhibitor LprI family protein n=1 Tax=unclassified Serratia (in: enterobacteria) TaxID=2647522 RepID=UPI0037D47020